MSAFPPAQLRPLITEVSTLLKTKGSTVCVAETAAGGILSASLLSLPGASSIYKGGLTLYTLPSRVKFAGWTQADIDTYKGPTEAVVAGLAEHVRAALDATYAVAESGTAGPTGSGAARNRTPGYVALAVSGPGGTVTREVESGSAVREVNMVCFAEEGLRLLRDVLVSGQESGRI